MGHREARQGRQCLHPVPEGLRVLDRLLRGRQGLLGLCLRASHATAAASDAGARA